MGHRYSGHRDSPNRMRRDYQASQFEVRTRQMLLTGVLTTYGTAAQAEQTLEKLKDELALQGIDFKVDRVERD